MLLGHTAQIQIHVATFNSNEITCDSISTSKDGSDVRAGNLVFTLRNKQMLLDR